MDGEILGVGEDLIMEAIGMILSIALTDHGVMIHTIVDFITGVTTDIIDGTMVAM